MPIIKHYYLQAFIPTENLFTDMGIIKLHNTNILLPIGNTCLVPTSILKWEDVT